MRELLRQTKTTYIHIPLGVIALVLNLIAVSPGSACWQGSTGPQYFPDTSAKGLASVRANQDSSSQTSVNERSLKWDDMFANLPGDWVRYSEETFRAENVPAIFGMAALTAALIATDYETWQVEKKWYDESRVFHDVSDAFVFTGDGKFQFGIVGIFVGYGFAFGDARALRTASQTTEAILACGAVVQLLKHVTGRESPYVSTERTGAWRFFPNQLDYIKHVPNYDAFPSGHIATAMATLIVVSENYPEVRWLKPAGFVTLGVISSSLVATGIHWWSDIPLGLALGYSFGELASHPIVVGTRGDRGRDGMKVSIVPLLLPEGAGVTLALTF